MASGERGNEGNKVIEVAIGKKGKRRVNERKILVSL